jgi:hypothetical protein
MITDACMQHDNNVTEFLKNNYSTDEHNKLEQNAHKQLWEHEISISVTAMDAGEHSCNQIQQLKLNCSHK